MKRTIVIITVVVIVLAIAAGVYFGNKNNSAFESSSTVPPLNSEPSQSTDAGNAVMLVESSAKPSDSSEIASQSSGVNYREMGQSLVADTLSYMFGGCDSSDIINTLGEPGEKENMDYFYRWYFKQGIELDVLKVNDHPEITHYIYFSNKCELKTGRDIGIGSTYDQVMKAYQDVINFKYTKEDIVVAGIPEEGMVFFLKENKVSSIYMALNNTSTEYFRSSDAMPTGSNSPTPQKLPPDWHYDLMKDGLYRTDRNTGEAIRINEQEYALNIVITDDWVYFYDNSCLYRMDNENNREPIIDAAGRSLSLNDGWLYYISDSGIVRIRPDGSEKEQILECVCNGIAPTDKYVFYALNVPEADELNSEPGAEDGPHFIGELHRVDLNGGGDEKIADMITDLGAYENIVYFADGDDFEFYSMNPDTLDKASVDKVLLVDDSYFDSGYIFYISNIDRQLYRLSLADGTLTQLTKSYFNRCLGVLNGYVYGSNNAPDADNNFYKIRIDGVAMEKVE